MDAEPVVTRILEREGHTVLSTDSVDEALRMVATVAPNLLLTNVLLPALRGHDAADLLRKVHPSMRVLMVAGLPDDRQIHDMTTGDGIEPFPTPFSARSSWPK